MTRLPRGRVALGAIGLAAAAGLAMFLAPLPGVKAGAMNGLGLISVLPVLSLAGLALLIAAFTAMLALRRPVPLMLGVMLVAIVVCLDGVTAVAEPLPRFPTTYQIYGFVNYVSHAGHAAPGVSVRRAAVLRRQLGRPGLLLTAVLQLPPLPDVRRRAADLVRPPARPGCHPGPGPVARGGRSPGRVPGGSGRRRPGRFCPAAATGSR